MEEGRPGFWAVTEAPGDCKSIQMESTVSNLLQHGVQIPKAGHLRNRRQEV